MVDRLERLVNLVIALRETRRPLTVDDINRRVAGYEGDRGDSWRRMFERDKADLRDLGVPVVTAKVDRFAETLGYRIDPRDYDLPGIGFEPAELTALALAVQLTGLGDDAVPGLDKLAVDADMPGAQRVGPLPLALGLDAPNRGVLTDALLSRRRVRFDYQRAADADRATQRRRVEPHALLHYRGRWYLRGHDRDREDLRTFRLDRISGAVRLVGETDAFEVPPGIPDPRDVVPGAVAETVDAVVRVSESIAWAVARRARGAGEADDEPGWRRFTIRMADPDTFLAWALDQGCDLEVVGPPQLRKAVIDHLTGIVS